MEHCNYRLLVLIVYTNKSRKSNNFCVYYQELDAQEVRFHVLVAVHIYRYDASYATCPAVPIDELVAGTPLVDNITLPKNLTLLSFSISINTAILSYYKLTKAYFHILALSINSMSIYQLY